MIDYWLIKKIHLISSLGFFGALVAMPFAVVAGGIFMQTDWRSQIPSSASECSVAGGVWINAACTARAPVDQLGWDAYFSIDPTIAVLNNGENIQAIKSKEKIIFTSDGDFPFSGNNTTDFTSDEDFSGALSQTDTVVKNDGIELDTMGTETAWLYDESLSFDPSMSGLMNSLTLGDLNGDGHLDMMVGDSDGYWARGYINDGNNVWTPSSGWDIQIFENYLTTALGDLDNDGDLDLLVAFTESTRGHVYGYINNDPERGGTLSAGPVWAAYPSWNFDTVQQRPDGELVDVDNDGDLDFSYCAASRCFTRINIDMDDGVIDEVIWAGHSDLAPADTGMFMSPTYADIDGDTIPDLMVGNDTSLIQGFKGNGGISDIWSAMPEWNLAHSRHFGRPALGDLDQDGDYDLVVGDSGSNISVYINGTYAESGTYLSQIIDPGMHAGFSTLEFSATTTPDTSVSIRVRAGDHPTDTNDSTWGGWIDVLNSGDSISAVGFKRYFQFEARLESTNPVATPRLENVRIWVNRYPVVDKVMHKNDTLIPKIVSLEPIWDVNSAWNFNSGVVKPRPAMAFLDGDKFQDVMIGNARNVIYGYQNTGGNRWLATPLWDLDVSLAVGFPLVDVVPILGDLDGDGDTDMLVGGRYNQYFGGVYGFINSDPLQGGEGSLGPVWQYHEAWNLKLGYSFGMYPFFGALIDMDHDGDLDFIGYGGELPVAWRNEDIKEGDSILDGPVWGVTMTAWRPPNIASVGDTLLSIAGGDLDFDQIPDILIGSRKGVSYAYEYLDGSDSRWEARPGWNGPDIDLNISSLNPSLDLSRPTLVDLDQDGDFDMLVGESNGQILGYTNNPIVTYEEIGVYTSGLIEINAGFHAGLSSLDYSATIIGASGITVEVRAGDTTYPDDGSWSDWLEVIPGVEGNIEDLGLARYVQYRVTFSSLGSANDPAVLEDLTIVYHAYKDGELVSTPFNTNDADVRLFNIQWKQATSSASDVTVQVRTAADDSGKPGVWSDWMGPGGSFATYWNSENFPYTGGCSGAVNVVCNLLPSDLTDGVNDQWLQFKVGLISKNGADTATLFDIGLGYRSTDPGITVSPIAGLVTSEDLDSDSFSIVLDAPPSGVVTIPLSVSSTEGVLDRSFVEFNSGDWFVPQVVTVTGTEDGGEPDGATPYTIITSPATGATEYQGLDADNVQAINLDNDSGVIVSSYLSNQLLLTEAEGPRHTQHFSVSLSDQPLPTTTIRIDFTNGAPTQATLSKSFVEFNSETWDTPEVIAVTAINDFRLEHEVGFTITLSEISGSGDSRYDGYKADDISVVIIDDEEVGITVEHDGLLNTSEEFGTQESFTIVLDSEPSADVNISIASDNLFEAIPLIDSVRFTPMNWNIPREIQVWGMDSDTVVDGEQAFNIIFPSVVSDDDDYRDYPIDTIPGLNQDNDFASITVTPRKGLSTTSKGGEAVFSVVLDYAPNATVTIPIYSDNEDEGKPSVDELVFTSRNWYVPQYVTVIGNNNTPEERPVTYNIVLDPAESLGGYSGVDAGDVEITNYLDYPGYVVSPREGLFLREGGESITVDISLSSPPPGPVEVAVQSSNVFQFKDDAASPLLFDVDTWDDPRTVTLTAHDDTRADGLKYEELVIVVHSIEPPYGRMYEAIPVAVADDDSAGIYITDKNLVTTETQGRANVGVVLGQAPTQEVTVTFTSDNTDEGKVLTPASVTFNSSNYYQPKIVTIEGVDDGAADGDVIYNLDVTIASNDNLYKDMSVESIPVVNRDNEKGIVITPLETIYTSESGRTKIVSVALNQKPEHDVSFQWTTDKPTEGVILPFNMQFSPSNWNRAQFAILTGVDDKVIDIDVPYHYTASNFESLDPDFAALGGFSFPAVNLEATSFEVFVTLSGKPVVLTEDGDDAELTITLSSRPSRDIVIPLRVTDSSEAKVPDHIVIPADGLAWQGVQFMVTGLDDTELDGPQHFQLVIGAFETDDENYSGYTPEPVDLVVMDNEYDTHLVRGTGWYSEYGGFGRVDSIGSGDFNGDGHIDLVGAGVQHNPRVFYGDGTGDYAAATEIVTINDSFFDSEYDGSIISGNFNGDEYDDLVIASYGGFGKPGWVAVYHGSRDGITSRSWLIQGSGNDFIGEVARGRLNNDVVDDLVIGVPGAPNGQVSIFYGSLSGLPAAVTELDGVVVNGGSGDQLGDLLAVGDVDGDGYDDIVTASPDSFNAYIFYSETDGSGVLVTPQQTRLQRTVGADDLDIGDINNDGDMDVVLSSVGGVGTINGYHGPFEKDSTVFNQGWSIYGEKVDGKFGASFSLLDANADGLTDMVVGAYLDDVPVRAHLGAGWGWGGTRLYIGAGIGLDINPDPVIVHYPGEDSRFGWTVNNLGDIRGDGFEYYAVSAPFYDSLLGRNTHEKLGAIHIFGMRPTPVPGISVSPSEGLITSEWGDSTTFELSLKTQPNTDVDLILTVPSGKANVEPPFVTFTRDDWRNATVTVKGQDDSAPTGPTPYQVHIISSSSEDDYDGVTASVELTNLDDDTTGVVVAPTLGLVTSESSGTDSFSVVLSSPPTNEVRISMTSSSPEEGLPSTDMLIFNETNWYIPQWVSVVGQDDTNKDYDVDHQIHFTVISDDENYDSIPISSIGVTNLDNDSVPNITVTAVASVITEAENETTRLKDIDKGIFVVKRTGATDLPLTVFYSLGGSAKEGIDYPVSAGNVTIPAGQSSETVEIYAVSDYSAEDDETIVMTVMDNVLYGVGKPSSATIVVVDNRAIDVPEVNLVADQVGLEGTVIQVRAFLSGTPEEYPVHVPYTVGGTSDIVADHSAMDSVLTIEEGIEGGIEFALVDDGIADSGETVSITLGLPYFSETEGEPKPIAKLGYKIQHTVTIIDPTNVPPSVELTPVQATKLTRVLVTSLGTVAITAHVEDQNHGDTHTFDWSESNPTLVNIDNGNDLDFIFDPQSLAEGFYKIILTVTDNGFPNPKETTVELLLEILHTVPVLIAVDSDGDNINDSDEGYHDSDNDGIPNYLDSESIPAYELQVLGADSENYVMTTEPGLELSLGDVAFAAGADGALTTEEEIAQFGDGEGGEPTASADDVIPNSGGYFDFEIARLPSAGQSVNVTIPLLAPLPFNSAYRKYHPETGWRDFVVDEFNIIYSAPGSPGVCPQVGSNLYTPGLSAGDYCVQLLIQDGGPNDMDGVPNRVIKDPAQTGQAHKVEVNRNPQAFLQEVGIQKCSGSTTNVLMDGSGSFDADGDELHYEWRGLFGTLEGALVEIPMTVGVNQILFVAEDIKGGSDNVLINVTVEDTEAPLIRLDASSITIEAETKNGASYAVTPNISDNCDDAATYTLSPSMQVYPLGKTVVEIQAEDRSGNVAIASMTITVTESASLSIGENEEISSSGGGVIHPFLFLFLLAGWLRYSSLVLRF